LGGHERALGAAGLGLGLLQAADGIPRARRRQRQLERAEPGALLVESQHARPPETPSQSGHDQSHRGVDAAGALEAQRERLDVLERRRRVVLAGALVLAAAVAVPASASIGPPGVGIRHDSHGFGVRTAITITSSTRA